MNLTAINFGAKIAAGIGVNQIVSAACKSVMPKVGVSPTSVVCL